MLRVRLLGELAIDADGRALEPPAGRPARSLLAWLALHPGSHDRATVASRLWPDVLDSSARTSLRTALALLRRALGRAADDHLVATRARIGLRAVWVDAIELRRLLADERFEEALALWRGEPLAGFTDDWAYDARDECRDGVAEALGRLAAAAEDAGDLRSALRWTRRQVALDPFGEDAHRSLIERLAASGDRAGALAAYARLRARLRQELGISPAPMTQRLVERLRAGQVEDVAGSEGKGVGAAAELPSAALSLPPALGRPASTAFTGRATALERLRFEWERVRGGGRALVAIAGDPGIGKTRLAAEFARGVHATGTAVLAGRCYEETTAPYQPIVEALRDHVSAVPPAQLRAALGRWGGELARLLPELADILPDLSPPPGGDPEGERYRLFEAVAALLGARPVVLVLDDLQWADRPTLLLMRHLLRAPPRAPLLVLATYRELELGEGHPLLAALAELRREQLLAIVTLDGLDQRDVAELIEGATGVKPPPAFTGAIHERAEGNPFFVVELLRHLDESAPPGGEWGVQAAGVPKAIEDLVERRLARLAEATVRVLEIAAVVGREFAFDVLEHVTALSADALATALDEAIGARVVVEPPGAVGRYAFDHTLIRDTLYERLTATRRVRLHRRIGEALEELSAGRGDPPLGELAHHFCAAARGGGEDMAVGYAIRAGERATALYAYEDAVAHYRRALQVLARANGGGGRDSPKVIAAESERRCDLLLLAAEAAIRATDAGAARSLLADAVDAARQLGSPERLARAALDIGALPSYWSDGGTPLIPLLEESLATLPDGDSALRARTIARLAQEHHYAGEGPERSRLLAAQAVAMARDAGDAAALGAALTVEHGVLVGPGDPHHRLAIATEMVALGEASGDMEPLLWGRIWRVVDLLELGDAEAADAEMEAFTALAGELRLPAYAWWPALWRAMRALAEGSFENGELLAQEALAIGQAGHDDAALAHFGMQLLFLRRSQGRGGELVAPLKVWVERQPEIAAWRAALAALYAELGEPDAAGTQLEQLAADGFAAVPRDFSWVLTLSLLAETAALLGERDHAARLYDLLSPHGERVLLAGYATVCGGAVARYLGLLASTLERWADAERHFDHALQLNTRLRAPALVAQAEADRNRMLHARGQTTPLD